MTSPTTTQTIQLTEYTETRLHLDGADRDYLRSRFAGRIELRQEVEGDSVVDVLNPGPHVGVLMLPSGARVEASPKIQAANVFYMLAVAYELPDFLPQIARFDSFQDVLEFVVQQFAELAEERIRRGLYRNYVEREENLSRLRGRILFSRDIPLNFAQRHRVYSRYSELSWDVVENQVIKQVAFQFANWPFRRQLRSKLLGIDVVMDDVTPTSLPPSIIDRLSYTRMTEDYRPVHQLCRVLMEFTSVEEDEGAIGFPTFLIDMNKLFELFIYRVLDEHLPAHMRVAGQRRLHLDRERRVLLQPDILIETSDGAASALDTKYKRLDEGEYLNSDLYQVLAYCVALGCSRGLLIYPEHLAAFDEVVRVRNSPVAISKVSVPLGGSLPEMKANLRGFSERIREIILT